MNFQSEWLGDETDLDGTATFKVGEIERSVHFYTFSDYHGITQLLNEAFRLGGQAKTREMASRVAQIARDMEWQ